jgi:hypothetical protein
MKLPYEILFSKRTNHFLYKNNISKNYEIYEYNFNKETEIFEVPKFISSLEDIELGFQNKELMFEFSYSGKFVYAFDLKDNYGKKENNKNEEKNTSKTQSKLTKGKTENGNFFIFDTFTGKIITNFKANMVTCDKYQRPSDLNFEFLQEKDERNVKIAIKSNKILYIYIYNMLDNSCKLTFKTAEFISYGYNNRTICYFIQENHLLVYLNDRSNMTISC